MMRRYLDEHFKPGMTMSQMELTIGKTHGMENPAALRALQAMLARLPLEKPTGVDFRKSLGALPENTDQPTAPTARFIGPRTSLLIGPCKETSI